MKRITHLFLVTLGLVLSAIPVYSWGQDSGNLNVVLISSTPATYQVGSDNLLFYDDGGRDSNVCSDYSGK